MLVERIGPCYKSWYHIVVLKKNMININAPFEIVAIHPLLVNMLGERIGPCWVKIDKGLQHGSCICFCVEGQTSVGGDGWTRSTCPFTKVWIPFDMDLWNVCTWLETQHIAQWDWRFQWTKGGWTSNWRTIKGPSSPRVGRSTSPKS